MTCKPILFLIVWLVFFVKIWSQNQVIPLWENGIPGAIANSAYQEESQIENGIVLRIKRVTSPSITIYQPKNPNGTAVLICPGGGYRHLTVNKEGKKVADWLNTLGITAFVLKYRLPNDSIMTDKSIGPLQDAQKAMRYIRYHAADWNLKTDHIGVMGFSAGGHLAASLSTQYFKDTYSDTYNVSAKPDFTILAYPVISMNDSITHNGSKTNLLGSEPSQEMVDHFSNELQVNSATPKTFLVHATDDDSVPVENSINYYKALKAYEIPVEMHLYETGGHGFGLGREGTNNFWTKSCEQWLLANKYMD